MDASGVGAGVNVTREHAMAELTEWEKKCLRYHGRVLVGRYPHYCAEWDELPIDETCPEFESCICHIREELGREE
jgi:hypothetical protein